MTPSSFPPKPPKPPKPPIPPSSGRQGFPLLGSAAPGRVDAQAFPGAFTLVELMAATTVLVLLLSVMLAMVGTVSRQAGAGAAQAEAFRAARNAFESVTRRLSQATLNTYWDYDNPDAPTKYVRRSELRFISGESPELIGTSVQPGGQVETHAVFFQAPLGEVDDTALRPLNSLLNTWGYYVEKNSDDPFLPTFLAGEATERYRLMEMREASERLTVYQLTSGDPENTGRTWYEDPLNVPGNQRIVAENIVALVVLPKLSRQDDTSGTALVASGSYVYESTDNGQGTPGGANALFSSKNQLPPLVRVVLIAIDEASAVKMEQMGTTLSYSGLFTNPGNLDDDIASFEQQLIDAGLAFRTFSTDVQIASSKWSVQ